MSLSNLFDIPSTQDFLRAILALLQEYEAMPEDSNNIKPKMVSISVRRNMLTYLSISATYSGARNSRKRPEETMEHI